MKRILIPMLALAVSACGIDDRSVDNDIDTGKGEGGAKDVVQQPDEPGDPIVPPEEDSYGTCVRTLKCPMPAPPHPRWCENGTTVKHPGVDEIGCRIFSSCLLRDGATCGGPTDFKCHNGLQCSAQRDAEGYGTCVRTQQCIAYAPPPPRWCENGELVQNGYDDIGCFEPPSCLRLDGATCGGEFNQACHQGLECSTERDAEGYGTCVRTTQCIAAAPPPPKWCENGELLQNGYDENGCMQPPTCLRLEGATCGGPSSLECHNGLQCKQVTAPPPPPPPPSL